MFVAMEIPEELLGIVRDIVSEYDRAVRRFPIPFHSGHEGYAVILEELDELWTEVQDNKRLPEERNKSMDGEALQVATMAVRFMHDVSRKVG